MTRSPFARGLSPSEFARAMTSGTNSALLPWVVRSINSLNSRRLSSFLLSLIRWRTWVSNPDLSCFAIPRAYCKALDESTVTANDNVLYHS
jgi:hypothetical protein